MTKDPFWERLHDLEKLEKWEELFKEINELNEKYFLFNDIVNELAQYKEAIIKKVTKSKQNVDKNVLIMKNIKNDFSVEIVDFSWENDQDMVEIYITSIYKKLKDESTPLDKKISLYNSLVFNKINRDFTIKKFNINPQKIGYWYRTKELESFLKKLESATLKDISVGRIAAMLALNTYDEHFPNYQIDDYASLEDIIASAKTMLNVEK
ncbi:Uncharacterised protein [Mycoplasmopsis californica]|uniref:Uncharacterized protein n=1 Tax=Mycoplasmopsis equigenitalium TaxID=114883 RepID=A0ABY5J1D1_9BACT|nr:hypothetical protein [Mycoplasmopsis equigenitalium]UUD37067.1 hypothetical protein NPA09_00615 [Mycoplasmopsis equigenitalium]VEU69632.1 Uncharacterised protein [Mycoplasmopsis californica]